MHPRTLRLTIAFTALAGLCLLSFPSGSSSQEDTAHLVLRKKVAAKDRPSVYIVQKGDNLSTIIRRKLGKPAAESASVNRLVRKLNPQIRNADLIYPGQRITLPRPAAGPGKTGYVVLKGDSLSVILHEKLGIPPAEMSRWIGLVKSLNPGLANPNRIYPGQTLILPDKEAPAREAGEQAASPARADPAIDARAFRPDGGDLDILAAVIKVSGGTLVRSGKVFIPLTDTDHLAVDCTDVPMAELADGSRVFLDFGGQIPAETVALMRSRWGNYSVVAGGGTDGVFSALSSLFGASRDFAFRRHGKPVDLGAVAALTITADWLLERKEADGRTRSLLGLCRTPAQSQPIPDPVARFAERKGFPVLEIDGGTGTLVIRKPHAPPAGVPALDAAGNRALVGSLLEALGYAYTKEQRIPVPGAVQDGSPLVIRTDYAVKIGTRTVAIHFGDMAAQARVKLGEMGMGLVQLAVDDNRTAVVEKVLKGLDIPFQQDRDEFKPPGDDSPPRWVVTLEAIRLTSERGTVYLVSSDADRELCGFIRERWNRNILLY